MNRMTTQLAAALIGAVIGGGMIVGCESHKPESVKTREQAEGLETAADMISRGEKNVADGKAMIARGEELKHQNNDVEGDRLIADGKTMKALGDSQIEQGRKLKDKND